MYDAHDDLGTDNVVTTNSDPFLAALPLANCQPVLRLNAVRVDSPLQRAKFGTTYLGHHTGLDQSVIIRVLPTAQVSPDVLHELMAKVRRLAQLRIPVLARIYDAGDTAGYTYLVVEAIPGIPLSETMRDGPICPRLGLKLLAPIADGLQAMWKRDIVHRGVTPQAIHMTADGQLRLDIPTLGGMQEDPTFRNTIEPMMAPYWSPEEVRGGAVDFHTDMWSFGATLYHAIAGKTPFTGETPAKLADAIVNDGPADITALNPHVTAGCQELLAAVLQKVPIDRPSIAEFNALLKSALDSTQTLATQTRIANSSDAGVSRRAKPTVGQTIANCVLEDELGTGAFGTVFRARHTVLQIDLAVKILSDKAAATAPLYVDMFLREARTAARIRHPNVTSIFEAGEQDGRHFIIMEYVNGGSIRDRMAEHGGTLKCECAAKIMLETAKGLQAAEQLGIVHRDIKPDNILVSDNHELKITDLGLAKRLPNTDRTATLTIDNLTMHRTNASAVMGTPGYISPEAATNPESVDIRSDLYSLGATAYHMLSGELLFSGTSVVDIIVKHVSADPVPIRTKVPTVPRRLNAIVMRLLAKSPDDRYQTCAELIADLDAYINQGAHSTWSLARLLGRKAS